MKINITNSITKNVIAHLFGQGVTILGTILIPWACLAKWTAADFGCWVVASAIAQFFAFSDFGLSIALSNHICLDQRLNIEEAKQSFASGSRLVFKKITWGIFATLLGSILIFVILNALDIEKSGSLTVMTFLLCAGMCTQPTSNLYIGSKRLENKNGLGVFHVNLLRLCEVLLLIFAIMLGADMLFSSVAIFGGRIFSSVLLLKKIQGFEFHPNSDLMPKEIKKAGWGLTANFSAMSLALNGMVLVASAGGPIEAASFSAARTISRIPNQPISILFSSVTPELTSIFGARKYAEFWKYVKWLAIFVTIFALVSGGILLIISDWLEINWLHGKIKLEKPVLATLVAAMVLNVVWQSGSQALASINKTIGVGFIYLVASVTSLILAMFLWIQFHNFGVAIAWIFLEVFMIFVLNKQINNQFKNDCSSFKSH